MKHDWRKWKCSESKSIIKRTIVPQTVIPAIDLVDIIFAHSTPWEGRYLISSQPIHEVKIPRELRSVYVRKARQVKEEKDQTRLSMIIRPWTSYTLVWKEMFFIKKEQMEKEWVTFFTDRVVLLAVAEAWWKNMKICLGTIKIYTCGNWLDMDNFVLRVLMIRSIFVRHCRCHRIGW